MNPDFQRGRLKLKGKFESHKNKIEEKVREYLEEQENGQRDKEFASTLQSNHNPEQRERIILSKPIQEGIGQIMSSGQTVHGQNTDFTKHLESGDYIIINNLRNEDETRKITTIFSSRSMMLEKSFEHDIITFVPFRFRKQPTTKELQTVEEQVQDTFKDITKKIKKPQTTLEYRTKIGMWAYKTVKEKLDGELSREDLLQLRSKKNRDKHCWC